MIKQSPGRYVYNHKNFMTPTIRDERNYMILKKLVLLVLCTQIVAHPLWAQEDDQKNQVSFLIPIIVGTLSTAAFIIGNSEYLNYTKHQELNDSDINLYVQGPAIEKLITAIIPLKDHFKSIPKVLREGLQSEAERHLFHKTFHTGYGASFKKFCARPFKPKAYQWEENLKKEIPSIFTAQIALRVLFFQHQTKLSPARFYQKLLNQRTKAKTLHDLGFSYYKECTSGEINSTERDDYRINKLKETLADWSCIGSKQYRYNPLKFIEQGKANNVIYYTHPDVEWTNTRNHY